MKELTIKEATLIVSKKVDEIGKLSNIDLAILEDETMSFEFGWVFFYQSRKYMETKDFGEMIGGNAPIIVDKFTNKTLETGTSHEVQYYVDLYINHRDNIDQYYQSIL